MCINKLEPLTYIKWRRRRKRRRRRRKRRRKRKGLVNEKKEVRYYTNDR